jgi:hypothetical protein
MSVAAGLFDSPVAAVRKFTFRRGTTIEIRSDDRNHSNVIRAVHRAAFPPRRKPIWWNVCARIAAACFLRL